MSEQSTLREQAEGNGPERHLPRNIGAGSFDPGLERQRYRDQQLEDELGVEFNRSEDLAEESVFEKAGIDEVNL